MLSRSTSSFGPYMGSPEASSLRTPLGIALWPPAEGPSTTRPSTLPEPFFTRVWASTADAIMARKRGRLSFGRFAPQEKFTGSKVILKMSSLSAPSTLTLMEADCAVVAFLGQEDLDEVRGHYKLEVRLREVHGAHRDGPEGLVFLLAALDKVLLDYASGHLRERERGERAADR